MRRNRYAPTWEQCERMVLCDGDAEGLGPPPEVQAPPPGGVLDDPGGYDDPGNVCLSTGPLPMGPTDPFA